MEPKKPTTVAELLGVVLDEPVDTSKPKSAKAFCRNILESVEFRTYILNGIKLADLPAAVVCKLMDHGWGKPVDYVEVKDTTVTVGNFTPRQLEERMQFLTELLRKMEDSERESGSVH